MGFDLSKFTDLAEEVENESLSPVYSELNRAFDTIAELIIEREIKHKKVVELLDKSGLDGINAAQFSAWWNSKGTKKRREEYQAQVDERNARLAARQETSTPRDADEARQVAQAKKAHAIGKPAMGTTRNPDAPMTQPKPEGPANAEIKGKPSFTLGQPKSGEGRRARAVIPGSKPVVTASTKQEQVTETDKPADKGFELYVPWSAFLKRAKQQHDWTASIIAETLCEMQVVERVDRGSYRLMLSLDETIQGCEIDNKIDFKKVTVKADVLMEKIESFLAKAKL